MDVQAKIEDALHELDKAVFAGAVAAERERCAKICEGMARAAAHINLFGKMSEGYFAAATAIRNLKSESK